MALSASTAPLQLQVSTQTGPEISSLIWLQVHCVPTGLNRVLANVETNDLFTERVKRELVALNQQGNAC